MSCTTMKESHLLFRLQKNHVDLEAERYADNLICYLGNARSIKSVTLTIWMCYTDCQWHLCSWIILKKQRVSWLGSILLHFG